MDAPEDAFQPAWPTPRGDRTVKRPPPTIRTADHVPYNTLRTALAILKAAAELIQKVNDTQWEVTSPNNGCVQRVWKKADDWWRCINCKRNGDSPCSHLLAVLFLEEIVPVPGNDLVLFKKDGPRKSALWDAWEDSVHRELPALIHRLVQTIQEPEARGGPGRPRASLRTLVFQTLLGASERKSLRGAASIMLNDDVTNLRGATRVMRSKLSEFKNDPKTLDLFQFLTLQTAAVGAPYEDTVHMDGTGYSLDWFTQFFEEKHHKKSERREHDWLIANIAITYKYNLITGAVIQPKYVNERGTWIPLVEWSRRAIDVKESGGDAGLFADYNYAYAHREGFNATIKMPRTYEPGVNAKAGIRRQWAMNTRDASWKARANRRNNSEAGNHSLKARYDDKIYSEGPIARQVDAFAKFVVNNLARLHFLHLAEGDVLDFQAAKAKLLAKPWVPMEAHLKQHYRPSKKPKRNRFGLVRP